MMGLEHVFRTHRGKVRQHNEDNGSTFVNDARDLVFAVVADGMGGHRAGDVASEMTVSFLQDTWNKEIDLKENQAGWLTDTIEKANQYLFQYASENPDCNGMGTTVVAALCTDQSITIAHVGDSRCYHMTAKDLTLVTEDHTLVHELVRSGQLTEEEAEYHPRKHVLLRALGTEDSIEVDVKSIGCERGDYLLLCSDGLTNKVSTTQIKEILHSEQSLDHKADALVNEANNAGGEDNITIALIHFPIVEEAGEVR
jgi:serine/threonine protein phosphatase PrpC